MTKRNSIALAAILAAQTLAIGAAQAQTKYYARTTVAPPVAGAAATAPQPPVTPPTPGWTTCGPENGNCRVPGIVTDLTTVRFGSGTTWKTVGVSFTCSDNIGYADIPCSASLFNAGPSDGTPRVCQVSSAEPMHTIVNCGH
jgi:hypothetical protein